MFNAHSSMFTKTNSAQLIKILEKSKSRMASKPAYWTHWFNLYKRVFPQLALPNPGIPASLTAPAEINRFKADYYEELYRRSEIEHYVDKIKLLFSLSEETENANNMLLKFVQDHQNGKPVTSELMADVRQVYDETLGSMAQLTGNRSPLATAIYLGNMPGLQLLITAGADVTKPDDEGDLPVFYALEAAETNIDIIHELLDQMIKKDAMQRRCAKGTVLDLFVQHGDINLIESILAKFPSIRSIATNSFLWTAVKDNNSVMVSYLLAEHKLDPNMLVANISPILFQYLYLRTKHESRGGLIGRAGFRVQDMTILGELIDAGADINSMVRSYKMTPLMFAAVYNDTFTVKFLLEKGANPRICDENDKTAYDLTKNVEIKSMLEQATAEIPVVHNDKKMKMT